MHTTREQVQGAITKIIAAMCEHGFMNGWFGDVSEEFQQEQVEQFMDLSHKERVEWIQRNESNLRRHCGLDGEIHTAQSRF